MKWHVVIVDYMPLFVIFEHRGYKVVYEYIVIHEKADYSSKVKKN